MARKILIASDHGGVDLKRDIQTFTFENDNEHIEWIDCGTHGTESVDYPDYAHILADKIKNGEAEQGILICGTGIGISMAANRHDHIRAALCANATMARLARQHNNANVLCLGARIIGPELAKDIIESFLIHNFDGGRHIQRVEKINGT